MARYVFMPFFFNDTATTEIYTLSLHDALPILGRITNPADFNHVSVGTRGGYAVKVSDIGYVEDGTEEQRTDRKSTRLNSSHANISYAVFCLKKKKTNIANQRQAVKLAYVIQAP